MALPLWCKSFGARQKWHHTAARGVACREGSTQVVPRSYFSSAWRPLLPGQCWVDAVAHRVGVMGRFDVSRMLLEARAALDCRNLDGKTPEDVCSTTVLRSLFRRSAAAFSEENFTNSVEGSEIACEVPAMTAHYYYVPQEELVTFSINDSEIWPSAMRLIRHSPGKGIALLIAAGMVKDDPQKINDFLIREEGVDASSHSELLCGAFPLAVKLRLAFVDGMPLLGTGGVLSALETFFCQLPVPTDFRKLALITGELARYWWLRPPVFS
eukprot:NODE_4731_length_1854_cov_4.676317.p1 GENE.NODE_4731_length_1854_cov_4.676317~~NODE_4731_length_1854_cov_4.676317.p1  ORF type:complete len:269 (-),score=41.61 NODE_4731_length_1854_cov_4.676317:751-1557(-)